MNYNIKGTEVSITPELRSYVEKRLSTLEKFLRSKDDARADVELELNPVFDGPKYRAEIGIHDTGFKKVLRAEVRGSTLHEAIDLTTADLFREMTQTKKKRMQVFRHSAVKVKEFLRGWRDRV